MDRKRLTQLMGMTTSAHDGEALNAMRMANRLLESAGKTWAEVLGAAPGPRVDNTFRQPPSARKPGASYGQTVRRERYRGDVDGRNTEDVEEMINVVGARKHDMGTVMFMSSLNAFWEKNGYVTNAQYAALRRLYEGRRM
jgi:hypothetical protein